LSSPKTPDYEPVYFHTYASEHGELKPPPSGVLFGNVPEAPPTEVRHPTPAEAEALGSAPRAPDAVPVTDEPENPAPGVMEALAAAAEAKKAKTAKEGESSPPPPPAEEPPAPKFCPSCGWDLKREPVAVSEEDKEAFLASLLGGKPFRKTYSLFGGRVSATFRAPRPHEFDLVRQQCFLEQDRKEINWDFEYFDRFSRYCLAVQLVRVESPTGLHRFPESVEQWGFPLRDAEGNTAVYAIYRKMADELNLDDTLLRALTRPLNDYNALRIRLVSNLYNSDFYGATKPAS